jgi:hypothetical protein
MNKTTAESIKQSPSYTPNKVSVREIGKKKLSASPFRSKLESPRSIVQQDQDPENSKELEVDPESQFNQVEQSLEQTTTEVQEAAKHVDGLTKESFYEIYPAFQLSKANVLGVYSLENLVDICDEYGIDKGVKFDVNTLYKAIKTFSNDLA